MWKKKPTWFCLLFDLELARRWQDLYLSFMRIMLSGLMAQYIVIASLRKGVIIWVRASQPLTLVHLPRVLLRVTSGPTAFPLVRVTLLLEEMRVSFAGTAINWLLAGFPGWLLCCYHFESNNNHRIIYMVGFSRDNIYFLPKPTFF